MQGGFLAVFKCKICGGEVLPEEGAQIGVCAYCGTRQTLPRLDDERRLNLYERANHLRRENEYDRAAALYEQLLVEDPADAEGYWSLLLCRYGVEYVEDPATHRRLPTVHRTQYTSILDDENYKSALQYADEPRRQLYEQEAKAINEIQKGILALSQKEEPFDVFICYKETDAAGSRTPDSVLATELYQELTEAGFRVFCARMTLEKKLGEAYEPYIFAALHSSKVMVVLGTKPEYFNAVWVKNEWSRYLALIESGEDKTLIPAYRDMAPYDLPDAFAHLQAQDMDKLGFMQDLIHGIRKLFADDTPKEPPQALPHMGVGVTVDSLLQRAFLFLEDGDWQSADEYCEKVLDAQPTNARAYLGKLLADMHCRSLAELQKLSTAFGSNGNYYKIMRFGDMQLTEQVRNALNQVLQNAANEQLNTIYQTAKQKEQAADANRQQAKALAAPAQSSDAFIRAGEGYAKAAAAYKTIPEYLDAADRCQCCSQNAKDCAQQAQYILAKAAMASNTIPGYQAAIIGFQKIPGWRDADELLCTCQRLLQEELNRQEQAKKQMYLHNKKRKRRNVFLCALGLFGLLFLTFFVVPQYNYTKAMEYLQNGDLLNAYQFFDNAQGFRDSDEQAAAIRARPDYQLALIRQAETGDTIVYGSYEQDNHTENGKEQIQWILLAKDENRALLLSERALLMRPFHTSDEAVSWENSSLRSWLNAEFLNAAFTTEEISHIPLAPVPVGDEETGGDTMDRVFLLSSREFANLVPSADEECMPTAAVAAEAGLRSTYEPVAWWLRSVMAESSKVKYVDSSGSSYNEADATDEDIAIRPAIWVEYKNVG